jgi:hypothetical protein
MSYDCPPPLVFNYETLYCELPSTPGPEPTDTPGSVVTPTPPPGQSCPDGYYWNPYKNHCDAAECPPPLVFDWDLLYCVPLDTPEPEPTDTPGPVVTPTPPPGQSCPDGYYWNPYKNHCDAAECPPPLVFDWDLLYCVVPSTPEPEPTPVPTPTPDDDVPSCPEGYFWHPAMGHCMSPECPPPLVFDPKSLYCVLP